MSLRLILAPAAPALVAALFVAAPAQAQSPPFKEPTDGDPVSEQSWLNVDDMQADRQFTHVSATFTCPTDMAPATPCRARVGVTWFLEGKVRSGSRYGLAQPRDVVIPRGASQRYEVDIPPAELRDVLARHGDEALVGIGSVDPDTHVLAANATMGRPNFVIPRKYRNPFNTCGAPPFMRVTGATLLEQRFDDGETEDVGFGPLYSPDIARFTHYKVVSGTARFTLNGLVHEVAAGSDFTIDCVGVNAVRRGRPFPALALDRGSVKVSGHPTVASQPAALVHTLEGFMGTRSREALNMTVSRDRARRRSTMRMHKGRTGTITPFLQIRGSSPCTAGKALSVNWRGVIRRA